MRVGLVGCGRIAHQAHLPAYTAAGITVAAVCDLIPDRAASAAQATGAAMAATAQELAQRDDVDVIDVATPPHDRPDLLRGLYRTGKPILSQKPLAYDLPTATALVQEAEDHGVVLAVNHNARWAPAHRAIYRQMIDGALGQVYAVQHHNRFNEDVDTWYTRHPDYLFLDHGIHYLDLTRVLTGRTPVAVAAVAGTRPGQRPAGPVIYSVNLRYADNDAPHVVLTFVNTAPAPTGFDFRLIVDGVDATAQATLFAADLLPADGSPPQALDVSGEWTPDAFTGPLLSLTRHLTAGGPLPHSGRDHLASLAVAVAAAQSAKRAGAWTAVDHPPTEVMGSANLSAYLP